MMNSSMRPEAIILYPSDFSSVVKIENKLQFILKVIWFKNTITKFCTIMTLDGFNTSMLQSCDLNSLRIFN